MSIYHPHHHHRHPGPYYMSAYSLAVEKGYRGTLEEWLMSLRGEKGDTGDTGPTGPMGPVGSGVRLHEEDGTLYIDNLVDEQEGDDGPTIAVDSALSADSTNPVQNKVIAEKIAELLGMINLVDQKVDNKSELPTGYTPGKVLGVKDDGTLGWIDLPGPATDDYNINLAHMTGEVTTDNCIQYIIDKHYEQPMGTYREWLIGHKKIPDLAQVPSKDYCYRLTRWDLWQDDFGIPRFTIEYSGATDKICLDGSFDWVDLMPKNARGLATIMALGE